MCRHKHVNIFYLCRSNGTVFETKENSSELIETIRRLRAFVKPSATKCDDTANLGEASKTFKSIILAVYTKSSAESPFCDLNRFAAAVHTGH